jgi:hypothetical protein
MLHAQDRTNLDAADIQTKQATRVTSSFLAVAVLANIMRTFRMSGTYLIHDNDRVPCMVGPIPMRRRSKPTWRNALGSFTIYISPRTKTLFKVIKRDLPSYLRSL